MKSGATRQPITDWEEHMRTQFLWRPAEGWEAHAPLVSLLGALLKPSIGHGILRLIAHCAGCLTLLDCEAAAETADKALPSTAMASPVGTVRQTKPIAATPGSSFKECASGCPVMVVIPAGMFRMGSPAQEADREANEGPLHEVTIARPFAVSQFEITFAEWDACVAAAACPRAADSWGRGEMPVINVSWRDAQQYVGWLSQVTGAPYRLLTEAEWEYAARAGAQTAYSWGERPGTGNANCNGCGSPWDLQTDGAGRVVQAERIRTSRHARQCLGVGRGQLARQL